MGRNERRVKYRGHPEGQELFGLADSIAKAENPQRWFDGAKAQEEGITSTPEWEADKMLLKGEMTDRLKGGIFRDFVETLRVRGGD